MGVEARISSRKDAKNAKGTAMVFQPIDDAGDAVLSALTASETFTHGFCERANLLGFLRISSRD
ncbi:MAG: hypothetical protein U5S82_07545 [Gammaproteobacteria bacterium]|nr:hypothetical protein [Gammaproteobacteria bacterium]